MADVEQERRNRIRLSLAAYAYELENKSIISDDEFDKLSLQIDPKISTGNIKLDKFFRKQFDPSTGMWIYKHPELDKLQRLYRSLYERS